MTETRDEQAASGSVGGGRPTDSPWFWGLMFSLMALVGIGLIGPKFARRQGQLERRYLGRERAAVERARRAVGLQAEDLAATAVAPPPLTALRPAERIIPLWTLGTAAAAGVVVSAVMLWRERRGTPPGGGQPMIDRRRAR